MKNSKYIGWGLALVMVIVCVFLMDKNRKLERERIKEIATEKKESQKREDSLKHVMNVKEKAYQARIKDFEKKEDSILNLYEISKENEERSRIAIRTYLNASDGERFAKFRELLTEVD